jgi:endonuclease III
MDERGRLAAVDRILRERYPEVPALHFDSPFSLLVAAVLAAQCTDERVNRITPELFRRFPHPRAFAEASLPDIEEVIRPTGYFRQKARTLKSCGEVLTEAFGGRVPPDLGALVSLPGIGRKTANLVLGNAMGIPGVVVDTHVKRVSHRLGFTRHAEPERVEADLAVLLPPERQTPFCNLLTYLGREICTARKPVCPQCPVVELCPKIGVGD